MTDNEKYKILMSTLQQKQKATPLITSLPQRFYTKFHIAMLNGT